MSGYGHTFTVGDIFTETFTVFTANWRMVVVFSLALGLAAGAMQWAAGVPVADAGKFSGNGLGVTVAMGILASVASYIVLWQILADQGLATTSRSAKLYFINLAASLVMMLGMGFAFLLLIIPGFMVMARWSVASQLIIGRGAGVVEAMGESWALTKSRQWTIIGFYCLFGLALGALTVPLSIGLVALNLNAGMSGVGIAFRFLQGVLQYLFSGVNLCAGVAIFALVLDHSGAEEEIFA